MGEIMLMCALSLQLSLLFVVWQVIYFPEFVLLSSVDIATRCGLDDPGIESRWGRDFPHTSRPALGPTQPPVQWVPGLSRG